MAPLGQTKPEGECHQMLVKISEDGPRDWTAIEMQGIMEPRDSQSTVDGLPLGDLQRKGDKGVILTVGNQRMDGKIVELKQPLTIMKRKRGEGEEGKEVTQEFEIVGFIRRKMVFLHRPTVVTQSFISPSKDMLTQEIC